VRAARTVFDYDDCFISPRYGFRGALDYYALCAPTVFMPEIRVPTMVLAACDDPWDPDRALSRVQLVGQFLAAAGDAGDRRPCWLPWRRQRPALVQSRHREIPRACEQRVVSRCESRRSAVLAALQVALSLVGRRPADAGQPLQAAAVEPRSACQPGACPSSLAMGDTLLGMLDSPARAGGTTAARHRDFTA